ARAVEAMRLVCVPPCPQRSTQIELTQRDTERIERGGNARRGFGFLLNRRGRRLKRRFRREVPHAGRIWQLIVREIASREEQSLRPIFRRNRAIMTVSPGPVCLSAAVFRWSF